MNVQTRQRSLATPYDNTTSKCRGGGGWDYLPYRVFLKRLLRLDSTILLFIWNDDLPRN